MVNVVTRNGWGAKPPTSYNNKIGQVDTVFIHHTVTQHTAYPLFDIRNVQNVAFGRGFSDISYTLLVHPDGSILEGRIYDGKPAVGAHTKGYNSTSIAVSYIANTENEAVTDTGLQGIIDAIKYAISKGWLVANPKVRPHRDVASTACPGKNLVNVLDRIRAGIVGVNAPTSVPAVNTVSVKPAIPSFVKTITIGDKGNVVRMVQQRLKDRGWKIGVDTIFGKETRKVVEAFQREKGLKVDGIVGRQTWGALWSAPITG